MRTSNIKLNITVKTPKHRFCVFNTEVTKVLTKVAKVSGCEAVTEWIKPCTNHFYWSLVQEPHMMGMVKLFGISSHHS